MIFTLLLTIKQLIKKYKKYFMSANIYMVQILCTANNTIQLFIIQQSPAIKHTVASNYMTMEM